MIIAAARDIDVFRFLRYDAMILFMSVFIICGFHAIRYDITTLSAISSFCATLSFSAESPPPGEHQTQRYAFTAMPLPFPMRAYSRFMRLDDIFHEQHYMSQRA